MSYKGKRNLFIALIVVIIMGSLINAFDIYYKYKHAGGLDTDFYYNFYIFSSFFSQVINVSIINLLAIYLLLKRYQKKFYEDYYSSFIIAGYVILVLSNILASLLFLYNKDFDYEFQLEMFNSMYYFMPIIMPIILSIVILITYSLNKTIFTPKLWIIIFLYICLAVAIPIAEYSSANFQVNLMENLSSINYIDHYNDWAIKTGINVFIFGISSIVNVILIGAVFTIKEIPYEEDLKIED